MIIGIFCGSSAGNNAAYMAAAREVGQVLAQANIPIVYGGGRVGLMGAVADAALAHGGDVTGVMPRSLVEREIAHPGLTRLDVVQNMHERKARMAELATAFIALPGGAGTLEEIFEQWTWAQLGLHHKPCGFYNVEGYYNPLLEMTANMVKEGFLHQRYADMLPFSHCLSDLLQCFKQYRPPVSKWSQPEGVNHGR